MAKRVGYILKSNPGPVCRRWLAVFCVGFIAGFAAADDGVVAVKGAAAEVKREFFDSQVLPILQSRCYACHSHSSGSLEGDLALDWKSGWSTGGASGPAVVPGKPDESILVAAIRRQSFEMPPDEPLPAREIEVLGKWIADGAFDPRTVAPEIDRPSADWWSLRPLARPSVPHTESGGHPVDAFVDVKLVGLGLTRSKAADRATLVRRLYFDVHGLPPTKSQSAQFVESVDPNAYAELVDSLLASPRYGERWARHWLDVVHFADTHGFEHDVFRDSAWRYRDYVIKALNDDTPWQDFVRQQLATDVFWPERSDLIPALGYLGAGPFDSSAAGTAPLSFDNIDRDDQVTQVTGAFLSTTANCARCHDHKFDPVSQEDYYSLQAVFAGVGKGNREFDEDLNVSRERKRWTAVQHAAAVGDATVLLSAERQERAIAWEGNQRAKPTEWRDLNVTQFVSTDGADLELLDDGSILASGAVPDVDTYSVTATSTQQTITAVRVDVLPDASLPMQGPGRAGNGNLHLQEIEVLLIRAGSRKPERVEIASGSADFNQQGWTVSHAIDGDLKTGWAIFPEVGKPHYAVFTFANPLSMTDDAKLVVLLKQRQGGAHLIGRFRLSTTDAPAGTIQAVPVEVSAALDVPLRNRIEEQKLAIAKHVLSLDAALALASLPAQAAVYAASDRWERGSRTPAGIAPKEVHVLSRGNLEKPTELAQPGALSVIDCLPSQFDLPAGSHESDRRAALADWIVSADNPLTWRSIANRVWQFHFGRGLCDTPSDFGRMGDQPSHPELLDWLACELRDHGGSLKHLHRLILTSETYRQSSDSRAECAAVDEQNRLLWRANRRRLDAEQFFDSVLQVSGRIDLQMGGPAVQHFTLSPGQQATPKVHYDQFDWSSPAGARRAIYRAVWRGIPDPLFEAMDFPDLGLLAPKRFESVSALQSLTLWNHPFVLHHCEVAADRISESVPAPGEQIVAAFQEILLREPTENELEAIESYARQHGLPAAVRLLLNSNEFLFIN